MDHKHEIEVNDCDQRGGIEVGPKESLYLGPAILFFSYVFLAAIYGTYKFIQAIWW